MELLIAAGVPSAIVAFCFWLLERRIQKRAKRRRSNGHAGKKNRMRKKRTVKICST